MEVAGGVSLGPGLKLRLVSGSGQPRPYIAMVARVIGVCDSKLVWSGIEGRFDAARFELWVISA